MFETTEAAELPISEIMASFGSRAWEYVQLRLNMPWFYVNCRVSYLDGPQLNEMMLLSTPDKLCELKKSTALEILEVYLVTPGTLNGTNYWQMEQLVQVWQADDPQDCSIPAFVYVLRDGKQYNYSDLDISKCGMENMELLFEIE